VIHAVVDNYATHKHPRVRRWLARHPRWTFHFTPTSASWLNAVFAKLTRQRLKRGVFQSVVDLQLAINRFVAETNADPKPFVWTADPNASSPPSSVGSKCWSQSTSLASWPLILCGVFRKNPIINVLLAARSMHNPRAALRARRF
jgi:hypothetical protein